MPSAHLLRTLAAVAPGTRVAHLAPADAGPALDALGFVVVGGEVADASADWVVIETDRPDLLHESARVLAPGGWVWIAGGDVDTLAAAAAAGLVVAEPPGVTDGAPHAVFRKPGAVG